jgi:hypothetical protein
MKINKNDIDPALVEKITKLDKVVENFTEDDKSGFLAYNGTDFHIKRVNEALFKKILNESDLRRFSDSIYNESGLIKNSFRTNFNSDNRVSKNFKTQVVSPLEETLYISKGEIVFSTKYSNFIYFLNETGILTKFDLLIKQSVGAVNIITELKTRFAVSNIYPFDFLAIEAMEDSVLISTAYNGVLLYDFTKKELEVKFPENQVTLIKTLDNGTILLGIDKVDSNIAFYNFESGMKIESSNALKKKMFQAPHLVDYHNDNLFVVGRPYGVNTTKNLLHYWKKDIAKFNFNNLDGILFPGLDYLNYSLSHAFLTDDHLYISGLRDNKNLFIWQYDLRSLSKEFKEFSFNRFSFNRLDFIELNEEFFMAGDGNKLYFLNAKGEVERNLELSGKIKNIYVKNQYEFYLISGEKLIEVKVPEYKETPEIVLDVFSSENPCNNIDIYVKGSSGKEKFVFIDKDTLTQIAPYYIGVYEKNTIIKLLGSTAKNITMKMTTSSETEIEGIVVNADRVFLK